MSGVMMMLLAVLFAIRTGKFSIVLRPILGPTQ